MKSPPPPLFVNTMNDYGKTPLMLAAIGVYTNSTFNWIRALINNGADVNHLSPTGYSALHYAIEHSKDEK